MLAHIHTQHLRLHHTVKCTSQADSRKKKQHFLDFDNEYGVFGEVDPRMAILVSLGRGRCGQASSSRCR